MNILGITISGLVAFVFILLALFGLLSRGALGQSIRSIGGRYSKILLIVIGIVGLTAGGIAYGQGIWSSTFSTASLTGAGTAVASTGGIVGLDCRIAAVGANQSGTGITTRADTANIKHYYADVPYGNFSAGIQTNLTCTRTGDISKGAQATCIAKADSFRSATSTTDSNLYYWVNTGTTASKVEGYTWQQFIYLSDNGNPTTSSDTEKTQLVFAQDEASQNLNTVTNLPGLTVGGYLLNQTSGNINFVCDGVEVGKLTITKVAN